jgi:hypothetical protein
MTNYQAQKRIDTLRDKNEIPLPLEKRSEVPESYLDVLYSQPIASTRGGSIFNAHSYILGMNLGG